MDAWLTLFVVVVILTAMVRNWAPPDAAFVAGTTTLALLGIISPEQAFSGFSNPGMLTVAMMFVIATGLRDTGVLDRIGQWVLGRARNERGALGYLSLTVVPLSAFMNNTPIVAMFVPIVLDWCRRARVSPSRLLIPLSYLTILGGTCTLIGTSTNLVVNGLMIEAGLPELGMFELSWVGVPYALIGIAYLYFIGRRLLPDHQDLLEQFGASRRDYFVEMEVQNHYRFVGATVERAGLRQLSGLFLMEIDRAGTLISPVGPDDVIQGGDRLVFAGVVSSIVDLERMDGLRPAVDPAYAEELADKRERRLCEAVISDSSPLKGQTIRDADFRALYGAAVVAVHRGGERVPGKIGDVRMQPGDTLLMQVGEHFLRAHKNDPAFYLISGVEEWRPVRRERAWLAALLLALLIVLLTGGWFSSVVSAATVAVLMVGLRCVSMGEARRNIDWSLLITISASFGVGHALENTGVAEWMAGGIVSASGDAGPLLALALVYLVTMLVTEIVTNNAVAVLMFPVCMALARQFGVDVEPFLIALMLAASASFMTPIGYQTNTMVYGPGGYKFNDFVRAGVPLSLVLWPLAVLLIPLFWPF